MEITLVFISALVLGMVEVVKKTNTVPGRFIPVLTLLFEVLTSCLVAPLMNVSDIRVILRNGIISVLSAMGLWSGGKSITGK